MYLLTMFLQFLYFLPLIIGGGLLITAGVRRFRAPQTSRRWAYFAMLTGIGLLAMAGWRALLTFGCSPTSRWLVLILVLLAYTGGSMLVVHGIREIHPKRRGIRAAEWLAISAAISGICLVLWAFPLSVIWILDFLEIQWFPPQA